MKVLNYRAIIGAIVLVFILILVWFFWLGWTGNAPPWTGFGEYIPSSTIEGYQPPKTIWNLLELIIIPAFLILIAYVFTESQRESERRIADDHICAATMQAYLEQMTKLLLENGLRSSEPKAEVRVVARAQTLAALLELDGKRKGKLLQFLFEAGLIDAGERIPDESRKPWAGKAIVPLRKADLSHTDLKGVFLTKPSGIDLICANFEEADLRSATLSLAQLFEANLHKADLRNACLRDVDLRNANLCGADLRGASFGGADLRSANLSDCKWDDKTDFALAQTEGVKGIEGIDIPPSPLESV